jgi:hypothetical protein
VSLLGAQDIDRVTPFATFHAGQEQALVAARESAFRRAVLAKQHVGATALASVNVTTANPLWRCNL